MVLTMNMGLQQVVLLHMTHMVVLEVMENMVNLTSSVWLYNLFSFLTLETSQPCIERMANSLKKKKLQRKINGLFKLTKKKTNCYSFKNISHTVHQTSFFVNKENYAN